MVKKLTTSKQTRGSTIQDKTGKCLTEEQDKTKCWTEYCAELIQAGGEAMVNTLTVIMACDMNQVTCNNPTQER